MTVTVIVTATVTVTVTVSLIIKIAPEIAGYCKACATGRVSRAK